MKDLRVFLVFSDLSDAKVSALCSMAKSGAKINILVSYTTLKKQSTLTKLNDAIHRKCISSVMLDSGAYQIMTRRLDLPVKEYLNLVMGVRHLVDLVVGPDVPRNPRATLERLLLFSELFKEPFIPTLQSQSEHNGYVISLKQLDKHGLLDRAPVIKGRPLIGVGGLVGRRPEEIGVVVEKVRSICDCYFHLFGVNVRTLRYLKRKSLLGSVHSIDTSGWLSEIKWRRYTVYKAKSINDAYKLGILGYLNKLNSVLRL